MEQFRLFSGIFNWIERISVRRFYPIYLVLVLTCCSLFLAFPRFDKYAQTEENWEVVMLKSTDLTNNLSEIDPDSWLAKKVFRLTVPFFIKIFHLNRPAVLLIQFVIGLLLLYYSYVFAKSILNDSVSATFFTVALVFIYIGRTCFTEITATWFDGWAYFFLLMALMTRSAFMVFVFSVLAAWVDERAIVILPAILVFHQMKNMPSRNLQAEFMHFMKLKWPAIAVLAAVVLTMATRMLLTKYADMTTPLDNVSLNTVKDNMFVSGFGVFTFLEGFWVLLPVMIVLSVKHKNYLLLVLVLGQIALSSAGALFVYDVTRSGAYMFPVLFIILVYIARFIPALAIRYLLLVSAFFCLIFPPINFISHWSLVHSIEKPMVYVVFKLLSAQ